jgi:hypothetical protein
MIIAHQDDWLTIHQGDCRAVLIDLNPDYIDQQLKRNQAMPLGLEAA